MFLMVRSVLIGMLLFLALNISARQTISNGPSPPSSDTSNLKGSSTKQNQRSTRQANETPRKDEHPGAGAKNEWSDDRFIHGLDGAGYAWSRDTGGVHQNATFRIRGNKVLLKWEESRLGDQGGSLIQREEFLIVGRNFFRDDPHSCGIIFSGAQHCRCRYTITTEAIKATVLLDGKEMPPSGASFGICLGPSEIPRKR